MKPKAVGPVLRGLLMAAIGFLAGVSFPVVFMAKVN
jgi:hypothetical protein